MNLLIRLWNKLISKHVYEYGGTEKWTRLGVLHREDGPALIYPGISQRWYQYGKLHRDDGPAYITEAGSWEWWLNGERHRVGGPAFEHADGTIYQWWWYNYCCTIGEYAILCYGDTPEATAFLLKWQR